MRRRAGTERELASRDQRVLRSPYGQKGVDGKVSGGRVQGRSRLGWMDGVKVALSNRGMTVEAVQQCKKKWKEWRALVHM